MAQPPLFAVLAAEKSARRTFLGQKSSRPLLLLMIGAFLAAVPAGAQTPQQQYVYGAVPVTTTTSQIAAYLKNGQSGALAVASGSPFADQQDGAAMAVDALGRFLFLINPGTDTISMFQINQATGALTEVPASPFSTGPTENPNLTPSLPSCLSTEKSGQFLYVGRV